MKLMMNNESLDTSLNTARNVVQEVAREKSRSLQVRNAAVEILNLGFENQFEEDRTNVRKLIDELISPIAADGLEK
jgi:hypothetical protein